MSDQNMKDEVTNEELKDQTSAQESATEANSCDTCGDNATCDETCGNNETCDKSNASCDCENGKSCDGQATGDNATSANESSDASATAGDSADAQSADGQATVENSDASTEEKPLTEKEIIENLTKENADLKDQLLRRAADFDNYRKRTIKDKQDAIDYANANLLKDLLESLDNFDRTLEAGNTATDVKSIIDGISMINVSLIKMLETKYLLTSYGEAGEEFNPDIHEAIGRVEEEGVEKETLKQVYLKGYKLNGKVIRNAKVMVSVPKA